MKQLLMLAAAVLVFIVAPTISSATDLPRIMIAGEDYDKDTIPRNSRVFKRVLDSISNELLNKGFDVKDETALTNDTHIQGRSRRSDSELIQVARDAGIDVLVIFSIYPRVKSNANSVRVSARVEGRLLSVMDSSRLGNFESEPQSYTPVPKPYSRNDIIEGVGKLSKILGSDVGAVLADRLDQYHPENGPGRLIEWTLIFDGFDSDDMMDIEDLLVKFTGYDSYRPKSNALNTSNHHEYWYKSSIDSAHLERNMNRMLRKFNMRGRVYISGTEVKIVKQHQVKQRKKSNNDGW
jgi:hypothetical protein